MKIITKSFFVICFIANLILAQEEGSWTEVEHLPVEQSQCGGTVMGDSIYCMGGEKQRFDPDGNPVNGYLGIASNEIWIYDVTTGEYSAFSVLILGPMFLMTYGSGLAIIFLATATCERPSIAKSYFSCFFFTLAKKKSY